MRITAKLNIFEDIFSAFQIFEYFNQFIAEVTLPTPQMD